MDFPWADIIKQALSKYSTPFYLSASVPILSALDELNVLQGVLPVRNWLSFKTHPIAPLIRQWHSLGLGVEVVSEFELLAALREGFAPESILVNGVAKHTWLPRSRVKGLRVHFDSMYEMEQLLSIAVECSWHIGIRFHVAEEYDPDEPQFSGQFGMTKAEIIDSMKRVRAEGVNLESVHFHLRSNVRSAEHYRHAFKEMAEICREVALSPIYIDFGGGLPVSGERPVEITDVPNFDLFLLKEVFSSVPTVIPSAQEIWLENGRFITARSSVLVVRVLDIKEREDSRYLICDGGRTNHALVSDWEVHDVFTIPERYGHFKLTTICGPTCMAFDRLIRKSLPSNIEIGDYIVWMNAGAYHIPWENRFSHGLAKVLWCNNSGEIEIAREEEIFLEWWNQWK